jgi:hypothetical protein
MFDAQAEANARLKENQSINDAEFAYSPRYNTVGIRWDESHPFRIFNIRYPMYGYSAYVSDWISVGKGKVT